MAARRGLPVQRFCGGCCPRRFFLLSVSAALLASCEVQSEKVCSYGKKISLALDYSTNATGHPQVNARLEQPMETTSWQLDVELGSTTCGPGGVPRRVLTLTLHGAAGAAAGAAPAGYVTLPGLGHYHVAAEARDWAGAHAQCAGEGAALAVPASQREAEVLVGHFPFNASGATHVQYAWHGASDFAQEGHFVTGDGTPLADTGFGTFHPGQPEGGKAENCLVLVKSNGLLADAPCSWKLPYFCKVNL